MDQRETLGAWIKDAYAMEQSLIPILENHAKDAKDHPEIARRIEQHVQETRRQVERLKDCLDELGEKPSVVKSGMAAIFGAVQAPMTGMAADELVKNALMDFASENFEIASYRALIAAAEDLGETNIASVCMEILEEEQAMADWLHDQLPTVVRQQLHTHAAA